MKVLDQYKIDVLDAIDYFEKNESKISQESARDTEDLRKIVEEEKTAIMLREKLILRAETLDTKYFWFLPFVNDLKRYIVNVINKPSYQLGKLLILECSELREENENLRHENIELKQKFRHFMVDNFSDFQSFVEDLRAENQQLKLELEEQKIVSNKTERRSLKEKEMLRDQVEELEEQVISLQTNVTQLEEKNEAFYRENIKLMTENQALLSTVAELQKKLKGTQRSL